MKSIETKWKGYRFRSRTEARWAVFLEACGIDFDYEPEGIVIETGPYLPDFRLWGAQGVRWPQAVWLEVKGGEATQEERLKCGHLAVDTGLPVLLVEGQPDYRNQVWLHEPTRDNPVRDAWLMEALTFCNADTTGELAVGRAERDPGERDGMRATMPPEKHESWDRFSEACREFDGPLCRVLGRPNALAVGPEQTTHLSYALRQAYDAARGARFEFGQVDQRWKS